MRAARKSFVSGRGAVLIGLIVIAVVLLAMPLREYLGQRARISATEQQTQERQAKVDELTRELERWQDPEYVRSQARYRLHYVLPGEVGYIVLDAPDQGTATSPPPEAEATPRRPWFASLWQSVQGAND